MDNVTAVAYLGEIEGSENKQCLNITGDIYGYLPEKGTFK